MYVSFLCGLFLGKWNFEVTRRALGKVCLGSEAQPQSSLIIKKNQFIYFPAFLKKNHLPFGVGAAETELLKNPLGMLSPSEYCGGRKRAKRVLMAPQW